MQGDKVRQSTRQARDRLGGQADLGDHEQGLFAGGQAVADRADVDFGLAGAGNAIKDQHAENSGLDGGACAPACAGLVVIEIVIGIRNLGGGQQGGIFGNVRHLDHAKKTLLFQGPQRGAGTASLGQQVPGRQGVLLEGDEDLGDPLLGGGQVGQGLRVGRAGPESAAHSRRRATSCAGGDHGVQGQAEGGGVVSGDPVAQFEHVLIQDRLGVQLLADRLKGGFPGLVGDGGAVAGDQAVVSAQGHLDPAAGLEGLSHRWRDRIGVDAVDLLQQGDRGDRRGAGIGGGRRRFAERAAARVGCLWP